MAHAQYLEDACKAVGISEPVEKQPWPETRSAIVKLCKLRCTLQPVLLRLAIREFIMSGSIRLPRCLS